jgi:hypothetical protein
VEIVRNNLNLIDKTLYIDSKIGDFTTFLSTEKGFGTVSLKNGTPSLDVLYGEIAVKRIHVGAIKDD